MVLIALATLVATVCTTAPTALPASAATNPPVYSTPVPGDLPVSAARAKWYQLWGPASAWTSGRYNSWRSNHFKTRSKVLGIIFRCWYWRGGDTMFATIYGATVPIKSHNMRCDGHWKNLVCRNANTHSKYYVGVYVIGTKTLVQVGAEYYR
ncbi:hypothetical protein [Actinoallomurus rhizosphaericola]|uniref:hypothetical protein n=1 Tax=Actinoallomurus rhizosphaericola TaxID=2952536 RepID=UPI00209009EE|nr:hypothetical protein [Actinoallomurus rhizosphaericola]MCO5991850.1 hypothetical protein [Actinoallomurus rhizosphaericola]